MRAQRGLDSGTAGRRAVPLRGNSSGAAYVLAVTTLLVGVTLGLAMLRASGGYFMAEDSRIRKQTLANLAEAGVDYAYWQVHYQGKKLPYSADVSLPGGTFHVVAVDDGSRDRSAMLITSTATCRGRSHTLKRVTLGPLPYHYACCEDRNMSDGDTLVDLSSAGGIRVNGSLQLDSLLTNVPTGAWATSTIAAKGYVDPRYPSSPPVSFPDVDYAYYDAVETHEYWFDTLFINPWFPSGAVIYVHGKVDISGVYSGLITIVATGDINVKGPLTAANQSSCIALITTRTIRLESAATTVEAVVYAHRPDKGGKVEIHGITVVNGCVAGDDVTTSGKVTFNRPFKLDLEFLRNLRLPGL